MPAAVVVIPTYNERGNVLTLLPEIIREIPALDILIVDDGSPDGTAAAVRDLQKTFPQIHLLEREEKRGLGRAYIAGFLWALEKDYKIVAQMDADHSHRPQDLRALFAQIAAGYDFAVGSRWVEGAQAHGLDGARAVLARVGNIYARVLLGARLQDWTGGLNIWRAEVLRKIDPRSLEARGYSFQVELKYRALRLKFSGIEVPIIFEERKLGQSKMSGSIILEAFTHLWRLRKKH